MLLKHHGQAEQPLLSRQASASDLRDQLEDGSLVQQPTGPPVPSSLSLLSGSAGVLAGLQHKQAWGFTSLVIII